MKTILEIATEAVESHPESTFTPKDIIKAVKEILPDVRDEAIRQVMYRMRNRQVIKKIGQKGVVGIWARYNDKVDNIGDISTTAKVARFAENQGSKEFTKLGLHKMYIEATGHQINKTQFLSAFQKALTNKNKVEKIGKEKGGFSVFRMKSNQNRKPSQAENNVWESVKYKEVEETIQTHPPNKPDSAADQLNINAVELGESIIAYVKKLMQDRISIEIKYRDLEVKIKNIEKDHRDVLREKNSTIERLNKRISHLSNAVNVAKNSSATLKVPMGEMAKFKR